MKKFFIYVVVLFAMISCCVETETGKFVLINKDYTTKLLTGTEYHLVLMNIESHEKFVYYTYNGDAYFKYEVGDTITAEMTEKTHIIRVK